MSGPPKKKKREAARRDKSPQRGIQSAETACHILKTIAAFNRELTLGELSAQLHMLPGNVHRYLTSLQREGFVKQERMSGEYDLGPAALALGVRAMRRLDPHDIVFQETRKLAQTIRTSVWAAVWSQDSPVVISVHDRGGIGPLTARLGTPIAAIYSATGRVFLSFRDEAAAEKQWKLEYKADNPPRAEGHPLDFPAFLKLLESIRERDGLARVRGGTNKGISAMAAPVYDMWGNVVFVVAAVGNVYELDLAWNGPTATELMSTTRVISEKLGLESTGQK